MQTYRWHILLLAGLLFTGSLGARAGTLAGSGDPFTLNFDENGNGLVDLRDGSGFHLQPGFLAADPTQAGNPLVLTYSLAGLGPVVNGDVRIWEDPSHQTLSDVLRFTDALGNLNGQTADRLIFYSNLEFGQPLSDLADTGFPGLLVPNDGGGILEVGVEGNNGFQWAPGGLGDNVFNGISDVPEPGTLSLLALGSVACLIASRRRKPGWLIAVCLCALPTARVLAQPFTVVNVIPNEFSGETVQNAEPSIAVNPADATKIVIGSFGQLPGRAPGTQPYFTSFNGGANWANFFNDNIPHGDTTIEWSGNGGAFGTLYAARLFDSGNANSSDPAYDPDSIDVLRDTGTGLSAGATAVAQGVPNSLPGSLYARRLGGAAPNGALDHPQLTIVSVGGNDRFYIGINDLSQGPRNSVVRLFTDADPGGPVWRNLRLDPGTPLASGNPLAQDGVPVRLAGNGSVVYVVFHRFESVAGNPVGDVVVCRDVMGGAHNFLDPGKNRRPLAPVAATITMPQVGARLLGSERLGGDLSIAVDPNDADHVFVAWAQMNGAIPEVHVAASSDGGERWIPIYTAPSPSGLPALAVVQNQTVGLLFTRLDGAGNLTTRFAQGLGSANAPATSTLASFPNGTPPPTGDPYVGDYEDLQAVDGNFYGTFSASNDPDPNHFPQGAFFQRNVVVNGVVRSNFLLTAKGTLADTNGLGIKWLEIPDTSTNGLDVQATTPLLMADDFLCNTSGPITYIKIWGSWLSNTVASPFFTLNIWSDVPATATNISHPGVRLWEQFFDRGQYITNLYANGVSENFYRPDSNTNFARILGPDTQIWEYTFTMIPTNRFVQTNGTIYWLSVRAGGLGGNPAIFGWKTCPTNWNDNAVFGHVDGLFNPMNDWAELIHPLNSNSLDLAFAIGVGPTPSIDPYFFSTPSAFAPATNTPSVFTNQVVPVKWRQLPDTSTNGLDVLATKPKILADDFLCTATGPITQIRLWGSWLGDANPGACLFTNLPCFCLGLWSDVPATNALPSHPGNLLCQNCFYTNQYAYRIYTNLWIPGVFTNGLHEEFFDPNLDAIIGLDNVIWEYTFDVPTNIACWQTNSMIYWLSVNVDCLGTNNALFGWKTSTLHFKDNAVFNDLDAAGHITSPWQELIRPDTGQSLDLAFAIGTPSSVLETNLALKWLQRPDATPTGVDVLAGNAANLAGAGIRVVADDFPCEVSGYVTDITIWGSWLNDQVDPGTSFLVSFWSDVSASGGTPSHPGTLLWQWTFASGDYIATLVASNILHETFMDPSGPTLRGTDTQVYQYDFNIPPPAAFFQFTNHLYWLSVQSCNTRVGTFGWKTCITNDHFGDDASWTWQLPPAWHDLHYPPWHPFAGQTMDMAFALSTTPVAAPVTVIVLTPPAPPLLSVAQSGGNLTISWPGGGTLQSASDLNGPWTNVTGATSPYVVPMTQPRGFYRVRSPSVP